MKKLIIVTPSFFDFTKKKMKIGGLETYIKDLAKLGLELHRETIIYQLDYKHNQNLEYIYDNICIVNFATNRSLLKSANQAAFDKIFYIHNSTDTKFVIATDQLDIRSKAKNVITIQHGIAFDIPGYLIKGLWGKNPIFHLINKTLRCLKNVSRFYDTYHTVCVDYNYYNWFRTLGTVYPEYSIKVIPNYASSCISKEELQNKMEKDRRIKKIVFARRFVDYRGALLFGEVIISLLTKRNDIDVTFAGDGPLEEILKSKFSNISNVHFTSFSANDSVEFHKQFDIAVVPTIYSEGTSLSLCEAMAAGCVPIATHVGGMTNMILDGYNGFLVYPSVSSVYDCLVRCLSLSTEKFNSILQNSYESCIAALFIDNWKQKWTTELNADEVEL